ncbi:beta-propeller fold lactonase family protein [Arthrobacter sp. M4]|uniref:lactonase family protein n=1 Tax=Arthrobacter sp. M4 TaxID=218160 RepID=UPI001CDD8FDF|nr:beta-propeller fold lactonase family protein [Arthrobacter sp. M4]MCA4134596.1 lactonase family protein [Arthrobacter sp. M4]
MEKQRTEPIIWTGSYTADNGGKGSGIGAAAVRDDGGLDWLGTAVEAPSPSFLAVHPAVPVVYAVGEAAQTVRAYRRTGNAQLEPFGEAWLAGAAACHVAVDPHGRFIVVACWGDGQVLLFELDDDGAITSRLAAPPAADPYVEDPSARDIATGGDRVSRAHATLFLADGRILTTDLGFDVVRSWNYSPGVGLIPDHDVALPLHSGPRHLAQHASGTVFIVTEYSIEVAILRKGPDGRYALTGLVPVFANGSSEGDAAAELALSPDGRFAYAGVRGSNRIGTLEVDDDGTRLRPIGDAPSGGDWPRHHLVRDGWLHVAHERSNDVVTFALDPMTGLPEEVHNRLQTGSPTVLILAD